MRTITSDAQSTLSRVQAGGSKRLSQDTTMANRPLLHEVTGEGDPIVLVPGALTGWLSWVPHAERLAKSHKVIRVQLRSVELVEAGEPIPEAYGILTEREALLATVDTLGMDHFDLVGWSLGGLAALAFALEYPERVRTLTLIEPSAYWVLRETGQADDALAAEEAADRALVGRDITIDDLKTFLVRVGIGAEETDFESHPRWPILVQNRQAIALGATEWDHTDSLERLRSLDVPILAVKGSDTADYFSAIESTIAVIAPNATLLELPGDHSCAIQSIDRFLEALDGHLKASASYCSPRPAEPVSRARRLFSLLRLKGGQETLPTSC